MDRTIERDRYIARVKQAREAAGMRQEDAANAIGIARETYTNYELRRAMPQKYIPAFCRATGVNERWLLTGEGPMNAGEDILYSQEEQDIITFRRNLSEERRDAWDAMIELQKRLFGRDE